MDKIILKDGTEIKIREGASLSYITTDVENYTALEELVKKLSRENLKKVQFAKDSDTGNVMGEYVNMALIGQSLSLAIGETPLAVTFGLREMTEDEIKEPAIMTAIAYLSDEQAATVKTLYPLWKFGEIYAEGERVQYNNELYKCLQAHTAQPGWTPDAAPSLWAKILTDPSGEILPWVQPGSTNGYKIGDKVTHKGQTWESDVDNNIWEPGEVGTETLWHVI